VHELHADTIPDDRSHKTFQSFRAAASPAVAY